MDKNDKFYANMTTPTLGSDGEIGRFPTIETVEYWQPGHETYCAALKDIREFTHTTQYQKGLAKATEEKRKQDKRAARWGSLTDRQKRKFFTSRRRIETVKEKMTEVAKASERRVEDYRRAERNRSLNFTSQWDIYDDPTNCCKYCGCDSETIVCDDCTPNV